MSTHPPAPIRLLIAEASQNRAHELDSMLRDAGIATRPEFLTDLDALAQIDTESNQDLVIWRSDFGNLNDLLPMLKRKTPDLPVIVLQREETRLSTSEGMALGATDVVSEEDDEHLLHVVRRELENICQRHKLIQTRRALKEAEQRCELLLSNTDAAIAYVHEGMHIYANDAYYKLWGFADADDMLGLPLIDLMNKDSAEALKGKIKAFRDTGEASSLTFTGQNSDDEPIAGKMSLEAAEYEGEPCMQVSLRANGRAEDEPQPPAVEPRNAGAAEPTGIVAFSDKIGEVTDDFLAVAIIELDDFDQLQVELGLAASNEAASSLADELETSFEQASFGRLTSNRIAAVWPCEDPAANHLYAEKIRAHVEQSLYEVGDRTVRATVSVGVTTRLPEQDVAAAADVALRTLLNRREGANRVYWDTAATDTGDSDGEGSEEAQRILGLINDAIDNQSFLLLFQPIISLRGDSDEHYEVFLRLPDGTGQNLLPGDFLKLATEHGVAAKIDRWVILQSIKLLSVHRSKGHNTRLTINLTTNSVCDAEFIQWLGVAIKAARLPSDAVIFQITEVDAARHLTQARNFIEGLKSLHCRASLGRFGIGEDSFETLKHLPVEFVKLDGDMVLTLDEDDKQRERLTAMIKQLQGTGKLTIVPMVESATVLSALWQAGANYIQGHYLQEPSAEMDYDFDTEDS